MATLLECLRSLPGETVLRDPASVRNDVASVAGHIGHLCRDAAGYEVRREPRNYDRKDTTAVGLIGGPAVYREVH